MSLVRGGWGGESLDEAAHDAFGVVEAREHLHRGALLVVQGSGSTGVPRSEEKKTS